MKAEVVAHAGSQRISEEVGLSQLLRSAFFGAGALAYCLIHCDLKPKNIQRPFSHRKMLVH